MLAVFAVYQFGFCKKTPESATLDRLRVTFVISSLANIAWIFSWHYGNILLSMILMIVILISLIVINLAFEKKQLTRVEKVVFRLPFNIYFGWITVATVANATALLVRLGWDRFGLAEQVWAVIILATAMLIGIVTMVRRKDIAYGLVLVWAYIGILIKHLSASGFAGAYPTVIVTVIVCLASCLAAIVYVIRKKVNSSQIAAE